MLGRAGDGKCFGTCRWEIATLITGGIRWGMGISWCGKIFDARHSLRFGLNYCGAGMAGGLAIYWCRREEKTPLSGLLSR